MAEVIYRGDGQSLTFRKSTDSGDNSGDYTVYGNSVEKNIDGNAVTLKGNGDTYSLIYWQVDEYSYFLRFEIGVAGSVCMDLFSQMGAF